MKNAIKKIRISKAPFFLEFSTYRWREHCGHSFDNEIGYRTKEEFLKWQSLDPLNNLEKRLRDSGAYAVNWLDTIRLEINSEIQSAFKYAEDSPFPIQSAAYDGVYA